MNHLCLPVSSWYTSGTTKLDGYLPSLGEFGQFSILALFHPETNMAVLWKVLGIRLEDDLPDLRDI
jgi:hypothetical protein